MAYSLVIKEGAYLEMTEAYNYYEQQQSGLGERFLLASKIGLRFYQRIRNTTVLLIAGRY